ncbi:hypothetical protein BCM14_1028 [Jezberella montanilacus]|uniref:Transporter n=1 Tax=Jezberella montanilacus TaxID=323426 RepID=A0A2T0XKX1_9BURK|nr:AEC family transporter [Jezberella montanilacus]PRY99576.1 hypothetical protein BCM14_1028 [Jezberella montanilacus]
MSIALLVLPDFLIIAFGCLLNRQLGFTREFFSSLEKLVYFVLFPALLFQSVLKAPIRSSGASDLFLAAVLLCVIGVVLSWLVAPFFRGQALAQASAAQCGYRFNTYIALALALTLAGTKGQELMALIVGFSVPVVNLAAVYPLARHHGSNIWSALIRNPLLISTVLGLIGNLAQLHLPTPIEVSMGRLGAAAIPLGTLCVGASLRWQSEGKNYHLVGWLLTVKLLLLPIAAWLIGSAFGLDPLKRQMLIVFAAMPPATAAYVLAARMGGDANLAGLVISIGTALSAITIPLWLIFSS